MKIITIILSALILVNCSGSNFDSIAVEDALEELHGELDFNDIENPDGDDNDGDVIADGDDDEEDGDDDSDDDTDNDDDDVVSEEPYCPRYDLIVKSSHVSTDKLNYKLTFNGETLQKSTQGNIKVQFLKDGAKKYTKCSGDFINTLHYPHLKPLKAVEAMTAEIVINHSRVCHTGMPQRVTGIQVFDAATGQKLWDEIKLRGQIGACAYGYTEEGSRLRSNLLSFADKVTGDMAEDCSAN